MKNVFTLLLPLLMSLTASSQTPSFTIKMWSEGAPNSNGDSNDYAELYVYTPAENNNTGRAIVICPGGGYDHLALQHEGHQWGEFFQGQGITAFVLKYRMPHGNAQVPVSDAEQAMRIVRANADHWHINKQQVGIMGFSAGGHLASTIATTSRGDAKPDFQILFYPVISMMESITHLGSMTNLLGKSPSKRQQKSHSTDVQVSRVTPRAFICLAYDDQSVLPVNGNSYYTALYKNDVPAVLHVYPKGGHGFGFRQSFPYHLELILELKAWLSSF